MLPESSQNGGRQPSSVEIQFRALRDALDNAGRSAQTAEEAVRRARAELHTERTKSSLYQFKIEELTRKLAAARKEAREAKEELHRVSGELRVIKEGDCPTQEVIQQLVEENKRLRSNVGDLCLERDELKKLCRDSGVSIGQKEAPAATMVIGFENLSGGRKSEVAPDKGRVTIG